MKCNFKEKGKEHGNTMKYQLITDATADMFEEIFQEVPELDLIPMEVILDGEARTYGPGGDLTVEDFYRALRAGKYGSTSQITPYTYTKTFEKYLKEGKDVLYLAFSSGLSATYQTACGCAEQLREVYPERKILCIDTRCACAGQGLLVYEAALKWKEGAAIQELADWVKERRLFMCHWFTVDNLEYLKKGGRISAATAAIGSILQVKPLLRVDDDGKLVAAGKPRGQRQATNMKIKAMEETWDPALSTNVWIAHADCREEAEKLKAEVEKHFPQAHCRIGWVGPIIGMHTGPGMQALLFWGKRR